MAGRNVGSAAFPGRGLLATAAFLVAAFISAGTQASSQPPAEAPPRTLAETGLYADADAFVVDPRNLPFSPQYPLWTDGAAKTRWVWLPPGTAIDGSDPDAWKFPVGTRFWKEFTFEGRRVETRYMELRADGQWLYAAYEWTADGREAVLAPAQGRRNAFPLGEGQSHAIPSTLDCTVCHEGGPAEVLGFSALQLSPNRDRNALHAEAAGPASVNLDYLIGNGLIGGMDKWSPPAPSIEAGSETERVVLGYLHGNCGHCHNSRASLANLGLFLREELLLGSDAVLETMIGQPVTKRAPGQSAAAVLRVEPGHPERSAIFARLSSRYPALQMPPLGTALVDREALALLSQWIIELEADKRLQSRENQR
jgi:hypothetical protein